MTRGASNDDLLMLPCEPFGVVDDAPWSYGLDEDIFFNMHMTTHIHTVTLDGIDTWALGTGGQRRSFVDVGVGVGLDWNF